MALVRVWIRFAPDWAASVSVWFEHRHPPPCSTDQRFALAVVFRAWVWAPDLYGQLGFILGFSPTA